MFFNNGGRRIFTVLISGVYVWRSALIYGDNLRRLRMALIQKALLRHNLECWCLAHRWCFIVGMRPALLRCRAHRWCFIVGMRPALLIPLHRARGNGLPRFQRRASAGRRGVGDQAAASLRAQGGVALLLRFAPGCSSLDLRPLRLPFHALCRLVPLPLHSLTLSENRWMCQCFLKQTSRGATCAATCEATALRLVRLPRTASHGAVVGSAQGCFMTKVPRDLPLASGLSFLLPRQTMQELASFWAGKGKACVALLLTWHTGTSTRAWHGCRSH